LNKICARRNKKEKLAGTFCSGRGLSTLSCAASAMHFVGLGLEKTKQINSQDWRQLSSKKAMQQEKQTYEHTWLLQV